MILTPLLTPHRHHDCLLESRWSQVSQINKRNGDTNLLILSSYVQYSTIAARAVRLALRGEAKESAGKRGEICGECSGRVVITGVPLDIVSVKFQQWENGKPLGKKE